jgi:hypothetical protein
LSRDPDDVDSLVHIAADEKTTAARHRLFQTLRDVEVFFSLKTVERGGDEVRATPLLRLSDGTHAMMLYTSKSHPDLSDRFGGGSFADTLAAAAGMPGLDWVILSNRAARWIAIRKQEIPAILAGWDLNEQEHERRPGASGNAPVDQTLESLITQAVQRGPGELPTPIEPALSGRELFLELAPGSGEGIPPEMKVFRVDDIPNVVRAFLTRNRPGIHYGGVKWEALKEMIGNERGIDGVQIVNDADDWIVFDRKSLGAGP